MPVGHRTESVPVTGPIPIGLNLVIPRPWRVILLVIFLLLLPFRIFVILARPIVLPSLRSVALLSRARASFVLSL